MPWIYNDKKEEAGEYRPPEIESSVSFLEADVIKSLELKKYYSQESEHFTVILKSLGKDLSQEEREVIKEARAENSKLYKGFCFALQSLLSDPPGDVKKAQANPELAPYIDLSWKMLYAS